MPATAAATTESVPSGVARSPIVAKARPPAAVISATVASVRSTSRPPQATCAPSRAKRSATSRPMPLEAPVTSARLPVSRLMS